MKITALIPARSGSKRIPDKNIKDFFGHPLLAYTVQTALDSGVFDDVIVSTDDWQTGEIAKEHGAIDSRRPAIFAKDDSPDIEWIKHTLGMMKEKPDIIVILRPTNPFRTQRMLVQSIQQFLTSKCNSMRAVERVKQHPYKMWDLTVGKTLQPTMEASYNNGLFSKSTQSLSQFYVQNGSLEIIWSRTIKEFDNVYGETVIPYFTQGYTGFDLNTPEDWWLAEVLVQRGLVKLPEVKI